MNRNKNVKILGSKVFDLLIIGGGITGCGIALDAVTRGLKVALIEKNDFASGTSSKSTKLIHGGLRYLKQLDFSLVAETGRERGIVHSNASHLVHPEKMLLPLILNGTYGKWMTNIGLRVYDYLADVDPKDKMVMLDKKETLTREPLLKKTKVIGGALYAEYRTDDSRLVITVAKTASQNGAVLCNYVNAKKFLYKNGVVSGLEVKDMSNNTSFAIKAHKIVNASGPWVDVVRQKDEKIIGKRLHLTKGVHLVFKQADFPIKQTIYFDGKDGRMLFAIPRDEVVYVGTTDTDFSGDPLNAEVKLEDVQYVIDACKNMFPSISIEAKHVISSWSGIRPLIHEDGKDPSELSRKDEIFISKSGLISIAGGKLTGYRKMAQRAVDQVVKEKFIKSKTKYLVLNGGNFGNYNDVLQFIENLTAIYKGSVNENEITNLVHRYGKNTSVILERKHDKEIGLFRAELEYCIKTEMCISALDFIERRTGIILFQPWLVEANLDVLISVMTEKLKWDQKKAREEKKSVQNALKKNLSFLEN